MGLELAEQLGWEVPDVVLYPTGGGTGLIGMWKAFAELEAIGFIGKKRPRMVAVQAAGCAPMVRAYDAGAEHAPRWEDAHTDRRGHPRAAGDRRFSDSARGARERRLRHRGDRRCDHRGDRRGCARGRIVDVPGRAPRPMRRSNRVSPTGASAATSARVLFNCATGLKYPMPPVDRTLDRRKPIDFAAL